MQKVEEQNHDEVNPSAESTQSMLNHTKEKGKGCEGLTIHNSLVPLALGDS